MDNIPCFFFCRHLSTKISPTETGIFHNPGFGWHLPFPEAKLFLPETILIHRQNAGMAISVNSLFPYFYAILLPESEGFDMHKDRNRDPADICEDLVAVLEAQVEKQKEIIRIQDETIRSLQKHNEELAAFLDCYYEKH